MIVSNGNLKYALGIVANTWSRNAHQPVLRGVLFNVYEDRVSIATTDLVSTSQITIPCVAKKEASFVVEFETLNNYVKVAKSTDTFEFKIGVKVGIIAEGYPKINLPTMDVKTFPKIECPEPTKYVAREPLAKAFSSGEFVDATRVPLNGIHVTEGMIESTDGFKGKRILGDFPFEDIVLPVGMRLLSLFTDEEVGIIVDKTSVYFIGSAWFIRLLVVSGNYPATNKAYENTSQNVVELTKSEIEQILSILSVAGEIATVTIDYDKMKFSVAGETSAEYELEIGGSHLPNDAVINLTWMLSILKQIKSETFVVKFGTRREPLIIEDDFSTYFVMQWSN